MEKRSYVVFKDGHEEDISYFQDNADHIMFVTKTGVYVWIDHPDAPDCIAGLIKTNLAYRLEFGLNEERYPLLRFNRRYDIRDVVIDRRVECHYEVQRGVEFRNGVVLISPDANENEIFSTILMDQFQEIDYVIGDEVHG